MKNGIYFDISNEDYHSGEGVSKSNLDDIAKCPAIYQWRKNAPEDSSKLKALDFGTAIHCLLLEPDEFDKRFIVPEPINRRTNEGKARYKEAVELANTNNQIFITAEEKAKLLLMRDSAYAHPDIKKLLNMDGYYESSIYWTDVETSKLCKIRPDKLIKDRPIIVDIKKTADMDNFGKSIELFRYHVQDAMYCEGYKNHFGELPHFIFVAISETIDCGRYPSRAFVLDDYDKSIGNQLFRRDLNKFAECEDTGNWTGIEIINRPSWARRNDDE